jgi:hypothetical protein
MTWFNCSTIPFTFSRNTTQMKSLDAHHHRIGFIPQPERFLLLENHFISFHVLSSLPLYDTGCIHLPGISLIFATHGLLPPPTLRLLQHACLVCIKHIDHTAQLLNCCQCRIVTFISLRLIIDNQTPCSLVQYSNDHFIEDHL